MTTPEERGANLPAPDEQNITDVPYATEGIEEERRRAASAQFVVQSDVGSDAVLREAMDPANQSLAEALRLSFRVLQGVILVLIVLFIFSGVQKVEEDESGVLTRWGNVVTVGGDRDLKPGLHYSLLPYPAGEFILFQVNNRTSGIGNAFWPDLGNQSREAALERAKTSDPLLPGRDGYVLTRDGDLGHLKLSARYTIDNPYSYVAQLPVGEADRVVQLALRRATVHATATRTLQELIDLTDDDKADIQARAQAMLDELDCGIRVVSLSLPEKPTAPFAIEQFRVALQEAKVFAEQQVVRARQRADEILNRAAGKSYREIIRLIDQYEDALELGEDAQAEEVLIAINAKLEGDEAAGLVSAIIGDARSYKSQVEATLGSEARRFLSQLAAYRQHPNIVVMERWEDARSRVMAMPDVEPFYLSPGMALTLNVSGHDEIAELRRKMRLDRKQMQSQREALEQLGIRSSYILRGSDYEIGKAGRQLRRTEEGGVEGMRSKQR